MECALHLGLVTRRGESLKQTTVEVWVAQRLAQHGVYGFSVTSQTGYWQGSWEPSIRVSCISEKDLSSVFRLIGNIYCIDFQQDTVLFTQHEIKADFIS
jgi:hypothetical protein